jgi:hypothetical protein
MKTRRHMSASHNRPDGIYRGTIQTVSWPTLRALRATLVLLVFSVNAIGGLPLGKTKDHWWQDPIIEDPKHCPTDEQMHRYGICYEDQVTRVKAFLAALEGCDWAALSKMLAAAVYLTNERDGNSRMYSREECLNRLIASCARFSELRFALRTDTLRWNVHRDSDGQIIHSTAKALCITTYHNDANGQNYSGTYGVEIEVAWGPAAGLWGAGPSGIITNIGFLNGNVKPAESKEQDDRREERGAGTAQDL